MMLPTIALSLTQCCDIATAIVFSLAQRENALLRETDGLLFHGYHRRTQGGQFAQHEVALETDTKDIIII